MMEDFTKILSLYFKGVNDKQDINELSEKVRTMNNGDFECIDEVFSDSDFFKSVLNGILRTEEDDKKIDYAVLCQHCADELCKKYPEKVSTTISYKAFKLFPQFVSTFVKNKNWNQRKEELFHKTDEGEKSKIPEDDPLYGVPSGKLSENNDVAGSAAFSDTISKGHPYNKWSMDKGIDDPTYNR